jgi:hypothetical protein
MNQEQQRTAIAEACGWKRQEPDSCFFDDPTESFQVYVVDLPDYTADLNAMREAEDVLTEEQLYDYGNKLDWVTLPKTSMEMCCVHSPEAGMYPELFRATAAQRAEAFLRTIGKWAETNSMTK